MVADHMPWLTRILRARGGSSHNSKRFAKSIKVFSAHAEVVPSTPIRTLAVPGILRARGGSSVTNGFPVWACKYSPRTRR